MANPTAAVKATVTQWGDDKVERGLVTGAATYYPNEMIALNASGYATKCDDSANLRFDGLVANSVKVVVETGDSSGDVKVTVTRPWRFSALIASASAGDEGRAVYAKYSNEVQYTSTNSVLVGWVDRVVSSTQVEIRPVYMGVRGDANFDGGTLTFDEVTGSNIIAIPDNLANALDVKEGSNSYIKIVSTDSAERIVSSKSHVFLDDVKLMLGTGEDITIAWDGTDLDILQATANSSIKFGVSGAGIDVVHYGDTAAADMTWDQSADSLLFGDNAKVVFGTGSDVTFYWDATDLLVAQAAADSFVKWGVSGAGINHLFYGDTATCNMTWDQTNDQLLFNDNTYVAIGTGAGAAGDIRLSWDGTRLNVTQLTTNSEIRWGVDGAGIDQMWYGDTASAYLQWDQSADKLIFGGVAKMQLQTIAAATGTAIPVTHSGSFPITQNGAETNTLADPTFLGQTISIFVDTDTSGARVITAASRINQAGNVTITLTEVGDFIKLEAITIGGALKWQVVANDGASLS